MHSCGGFVWGAGLGHHLSCLSSEWSREGFSEPEGFPQASILQKSTFCESLAFYERLSILSNSFPLLFIHSQDASHTACPSFGLCILRNPAVLRTRVSHRHRRQTTVAALVRELGLLSGDNWRVMPCFSFCFVNSHKRLYMFSI